MGAFFWDLMRCRLGKFGTRRPLSSRPEPAKPIEIRRCGGPDLEGFGLRSILLLKGAGGTALRCRNRRSPGVMSGALEKANGRQLIHVNLYAS